MSPQRATPGVSDSRSSLEYIKNSDPNDLLTPPGVNQRPPATATIVGHVNYKFFTSATPMHTESHIYSTWSRLHASLAASAFQDVASAGMEWKSSIPFQHALQHAALVPYNPASGKIPATASLCRNRNAKAACYFTVRCNAPLLGCVSLLV